MPASNIIVNKHLHESLEDIFQDSLHLLDTKADRDILKGIFATSTSVNLLQRKEKEFKCKYDSRGRKLKFEQWPDLAKCLEHIFDDQDVSERAGEGLEAHPGLKNEIGFRSKDNNTFMRQKPVT